MPNTKKHLSGPATLRLKTFDRPVVFAALAVLLVACQPAPSDPPSADVDDPCGAETLQSLVGQPFADVSLPDYEPQRIFRIGDAVTMDFIETRRNVQLSEDGVTILAISCG
ncbi:MAG: I78 family peptidase inhibitor [Pseudomonadota bacterium]